MLLLPLMLATAVDAAPIVDFSENFDRYTTSTFSGTDGWVSGTTSDTWSAATGGYVYAKTDNNGGTWGSGSYADNHLVYTTRSWSDFTMDVVIHSTDDDGIGVVFRHTDAQNFYMAVWSRNYLPRASDGAAETTTGDLRLYKVVAGAGTQLASSAVGYTSNVDYDLRVEAKGSSLTVWIDLDRDGVWDSGEDRLKATDAGHASGNVGFFCYDNGETTGCRFDDLVISLDDSDSDGSPDVTDCADADPTAYPGATETCDGVDDDCDGTIDEGTSCYDDDADGLTEDEGDCDDANASIGGPTDWYLDDDGDGHGAGSATSACTAPTDHVASADDCDDADGTAFPGGTEVCDGADDDCDGTIDEGTSCYDDDADGLTEDDGDCDDGNASIGAPTAWYDDDDDDGHGDPATATMACTNPGGKVATSTDCDDDDGTIHPGATETCDGVDEDCDGVAELDADGDGFLACEECDDGDDAVFPGATETCDGVDQDCDGVADDGATDVRTWYEDADGDGWGDAGSSTVACSPPSGHVADSSDCDDGNSAVSPGEIEVCNGVDDDCSGGIDDGAVDAPTWTTDADGDGYGDDATAVVSCEPTSSDQVATGGDCDDANADVNPGATEIDGNGTDEDCDGLDGPGDTGDTGDTAAEDTDTDAPIDTDDTDDTAPPDTDDPPGTNTRSWTADTGVAPRPGAGCGCDGTGAGALWLGWLGLLGVVARRQRTRGSEGSRRGAEDPRRGAKA